MKHIKARDLSYDDIGLPIKVVDSAEKGRLTGFYHSEWEDEARESIVILGDGLNYSRDWSVQVDADELLAVGDDLD